jgi:tetratricopeptide (TPR) repeat protein
VATTEQRVVDAPANAVSAGADESGRRDEAAARSVVRAAPAIFGALVMGVWIAWSWFQGGFFATSWGPGGAFLLLVVLAAELAVPASGDRSTLRLVAFGTAVAFVGLNFLSILWADVPGDAWTGADKTLLYLVAAVFLGRRAWTARTLQLLLALYAAGVAFLGLVVLVRAATAADPSAYFVAGRLQDPVGYVNGAVALWMTAFWPALYLGTTRALPGRLRPLFLAAAGLLFELALLGQSRAWVFLVPIVVVVYVLLTTQRLRAIGGLALIALASLLPLHSLLGVFRSYDDGTPLPPAVHDAARGIALSCAALLVAGLIWAAFDHRFRLPKRLHRALAVAVAVALVAAAGAGVWYANDRIQSPHDWATARWDDFTRGYDGPPGSSRFTGSLGTNRYPEWVVAWVEFRAHPWLGLGTDNYAQAFLKRRTDAQHEVLYPHSVELRALSELGLVGTALAVTGLAAAVALALRRRRREPSVAGGAVAAALTIFVYWLVHGSVDWFWEMPALAAPAFGFLALAGSPTTGRVRDAARPARRRVLSGAAVAAAAALALVAVALPWFSTAYEDAGAAVWRQDRALAYARLDRAAALNPLAADPLLVKGSIALRVRDGRVARRAFDDAIRREPENWYAYLQRGLLAGSEGRFGAAARDLRHARRLNPLDPVIAEAQDEVRAGRRPKPNVLNRYYLEEVNRRFGQTVIPLTKSS